MSDAKELAPLGVLQVGGMPEWSGFAYTRFPSRPPVAKRFLKNELGLTSMEISLNHMKPGDGMPFVHRHRENEEVYLFLDGAGEFQADGELHPIQPGSCFRCAPAVGRAWRNTGSTPLVFVVIQAKDESYGPLGHTQDGELVREPVLWRKGEPAPTA